MHFLVTGGAGFIGSHVTEQLLRAGHRVTIVDPLTTGSLNNLPVHPNLKLIKKDIATCQPQDFGGEGRQEPIDGVAHLAAIPSVATSWLQPTDAHYHNLSTTVAVLQLCKALNIPRLVFASSAAVYGDRVEPSIAEEQTPSPISPYGLQKLVSEQYIHLFAHEFDLSCISLRLFNVFGPRQSPNSPYSGVISIFTKAMQENLPITIYGDGTQTRDFVFVKDVANAFVKSLIVPLLPQTALVCNVGTGRAISLLELVNTLKTCFPLWHSELKFAPARLGDIQYSQADISKVASLLGFAPQWSTQEGIFQLATSLNQLVGKPEI